MQRKACSGGKRNGLGLMNLWRSVRFHFVSNFVSWQKLQNWQNETETKRTGTNEPVSGLCKRSTFWNQFPFEVELLCRVTRTFYCELNLVHFGMEFAQPCLSVSPTEQCAVTAAVHCEPLLLRNDSAVNLSTNIILEQRYAHRLTC